VLASVMNGVVGNIYAKLPFQGSKTTPEHTYDDLF